MTFHYIDKSVSLDFLGYRYDIGNQDLRDKLQLLGEYNDPNGTSLVSITSDLDEQTNIIEEYMLEYIDGVECWHSRNDEKTTAHYVEFARKHGLLTTGGSDCHQKPLLMGTLDIPDWVAEQYSI